MKRSQVQMVRSAVATAALLGLAACGSAQGSEGSTKSTAPDPTLLRDGTITVCTSYGREPFVFEQGSKVVGFDIDLVTQVAKELDVKVAFVDEDFNEIASGKPLNTNFCDVAIAAVSIDGDRARVVDFSSPYFNAKQVMVVQKGSGIKALEDVVGGRVAVQEASTGETYANDNRPLDTQIQSFEDVEDLADALSGSQVDAAIYDNNIVEDAIKDNPDFEIVQEFDTGEQYGMLVKKDGNIDLLRVINNVLADMREDGRYDEIYADWFTKANS
jgi:polar amino acid transport system substrate-binding protein